MSAKVTQYTMGQYNNRMITYMVDEEDASAPGGSYGFNYPWTLVFDIGT